MPKAPENLDSFSSLVQIVAALRGPDGCPWDREQTHSTLTKFAIEEAHEFAEAVDTAGDREVCEELGDLLLQVVLNAQVAKDRAAFEIKDVIHSISEKMVRRHPHVFADVKAETSEEVLKNWGEIKKAEGKKNEGAFSSIPPSMPALLRSQKIGNKSIRYNFDWEKVDDVVAKVDEEFNEVKEAISEGNPTEIEMEIGDLLFSVTQLARHLNVDAEQALRKTNHKFEKRFSRMQEIIALEGLEFEKMNVDELEVYWAKAKRAEAKL